LFKTNGYISHPRISPDGKRVAFQEHPLFGDDRGYVDLADASGNVRRLTSEYAALQGLSWSPDGREIWYAGASVETDQDRAVLAITPDGHAREVFHMPGDAVVWDIASNGQVLISSEVVGSAEMVASPSAGPERNVSVLGWGIFGAVSADGKAVVLTEAGKGVPDDYLIFFRRSDGSAAVEIGEGLTLGITPDGAYAIALVPSQPTKLRILPTGAGETRTFDVSPLQVDRGFVSWMPGAKEFVFLAHQGEAAPRRAYRMSLEGPPTRPLTNMPGADFSSRISPNGRFALEDSNAGSESAQNVILELSTGNSRVAPLQQGDEAVEWDQDGKHAFVVQEGSQEAIIFRVDLDSGRRQVWKQIRPADPAGILSLSHFFITPSGNAYTYNVARALSALYVYSQQ
jgi:eukaryotic-like serine/threonine-protein kinase